MMKHQHSRILSRIIYCLRQYIQGLLISGDGKLACAAVKDSIFLIAVANGQILKKIGVKDSILALALSPDGNKIAVIQLDTMYDHKAVVYDFRRADITELKGFTQVVGQANLSSNEKTVIAVSGTRLNDRGELFIPTGDRILRA